jgi:phosphoenolpyruvate-protein phosphotransferase
MKPLMLSKDQNPLQTSPMKVMAISQGVAIGPAHLFKVPSLEVEHAKISSGQVEAEQQRLQVALSISIKELRDLIKHVAQTVGRNEADIFEAQQLILQDPELLEETTELINQQHYSAPKALQQAAEHQAQELEMLENDTLAARAADIRDVAARVISHLQGRVVGNENSNKKSTPVLIVANDLTPSDTAKLDPTAILGICTVVGGSTTHAAIIARALEIPAVAGLDPHLLEIMHDGQQIAIDGSQGLIYLHPDDKQQDELHTVMLQQQHARDLHRSLNSTLWRTQPGTTADGHKVQIFANVGDVESASAAAEYGAEGIGLLRTEFLFGGRPVFPTEHEQYETYVALFRAFADQTAAGKTIVARTLDAGADKPFPALEPLIGALQESNPALGLRGARIHLLHEELLCQQLHALLRAGRETGVQLHIMFPMIATLEEVRRLRAIYTRVQNELMNEGVALSENTQIGIMVETPAAALMAEVLAREVDFFSIGANDLFQYTMAADRTNYRVSGMFGMLEPAVWRLIERVIRAGVEHGKLVALCGELAADARIGPLLVGLGVQELSMSPHAIVHVKAALHKHTLEHWRQLSHKLLQAETAEEMQSLLQTIA